MEKFEFVELLVFGVVDSVEIYLEFNCWDFFKYFGFGIGVVMIVVCDILVCKVIFYVVKLDSIVFGVVIYYVFFLYRVVIIV